MYRSFCLFLSEFDPVESLSEVYQLPSPLAVIDEIDLHGRPEGYRRRNIQNINDNLPQCVFLRPDIVDPDGEQDANISHSVRQ